MELSYFYSSDAPKVSVLSMEHMIYLGFCLFIIYEMIKHHGWIKKHKEKLNEGIFYTLIFQQVFLLYGWYAIFDNFNLSVALPLHLCRISSLLSIIFLKTKNKKMMDVIFYFSLFAIGSLFYPKDVYHFLHINGLSYTINHLITVITPIFAYIAYEWRPSFKGLKQALCWFTIYLVAVYFINPMIDGNYFYLINRPFLQSLSYDVKPHIQHT